MGCHQTKFIAGSHCPLSSCVHVQIEYGDPPTFVNAAVMAPARTAVEVQAVRSQFVSALGLTDQRPDLVVRFGRGPTMPSSLRRSVQTVLV